MFKFINPNGQENTFEERVVEINNNVSPIKEIIQKNNFYDFSVAINDQVIPLEDSFQLQVNVKEVGTFRFIFNKDGFEKEEIINRVSELKNIEVVDGNTAKNKVSALLNIVEKPYLLFMIYEQYDDSYIDYDYFKFLMNREIQTFLIKKEKKQEVFEISVGEQENGSNESEKNKQSKGKLFSKDNIRNFFKQVLDKKFHFLLILVSTTLFEVSIPLAIVNIYSKNAIYVFLFICSLIGIGMNGYSYYDLFKRYSPKSSLSITSYITNLFGIGVGIGLFALFYNLSNLEEDVPAVGSMILIGLLVSIIICAANVVITYFLPKKPRK